VQRKQAAADRDRLLGIHRELDLARSIQESLIPREFPTDSRYEVYGAMIPAAEVGGDLFDFFLLDPGRLAFTIGDVSGKGVGAAFFMAVSRTLLRVVAGKGGPPNECLLEVNRFLRGERKKSNVFLTCFYGVLDLETGELQYSRAGHNPPYLMRAALEGDGREVHALDASGGLPLGIIQSVSYDTAVARLAPGDSILLFTDGITEAMNPAKEQYGDERLVQLLGRQDTTTPMEKVVGAVTEAATTFADGAPASDDITVMGVRYRGKG
jgi:sigma-B regulation protein RsbU (phosphoserine phosphatase)